MDDILKNVYAWRRKWEESGKKPVHWVVYGGGMEASPSPHFAKNH
jgi:hypothetical protein